MIKIIYFYWIMSLSYKQNVSEYEQEIPQSHTADQPTAPRESANISHKTSGWQFKVKQCSLFLIKIIAELEKILSTA